VDYQREPQKSAPALPTASSDTTDLLVSQLRSLGAATALTTPATPNTNYRLELVNCDLCGSSDWRQRYRLKGARLAMEFSVVECKQCHLNFINPRLTEECGATLYDDQYFDGDGFDPVFHGDTASKRGDAELLLASLRRLLGDKATRLLEVGGGGALLSEIAPRYGFQATMCDISEAAVRRAKARGLDAHRGGPDGSFLDDALGSFDAVVALEVVEHVYSPTAFHQRIYQLLRRGGVYAYTTGNVEETRIHGARWGYFEVPEGHIHFFSRATISRYLREAGFSATVDPYSVYFKRNIGVRCMERLGIVDLKRSFGPDTALQRLCYQGAFKTAERILGRARFPWAIK
jgi:2-polyprenyl-3-methyl-5-hydroxy-6-metoxy-1,4-benzoquinol methylase